MLSHREVDWEPNLHGIFCIKDLFHSDYIWLKISLVLNYAKAHDPHMADIPQNLNFPP